MPGLGNLFAAIGEALLVFLLELFEGFVTPLIEDFFGAPPEE